MNTNVYGSRLRKSATPPTLNLDPTLARYIHLANAQKDRNAVWADPRQDLGRTLATPGVGIVYLYAGIEYRLLNDLVISRSVELRGPRNAIIMPYNGRTPVIRTSQPAGVATPIRVILAGFMSYCPFEIQAPTDLLEVDVESQYETVSGALVEITTADAAGSYIGGCRTTQTAPIGVYSQGAAECRMVGNDFRSCVLPYDLEAVTNCHTGPDANAGSVTLF